MTITEWLDVIEKRTKAATEGPWKADVFLVAGPGRLHVAHTGASAYSHVEQVINAKFIAASRTDIPLLVARLRLALTLLEKVEKGGGWFYEEARQTLKRIEEEK